MHVKENAKARGRRTSPGVGVRSIMTTLGAGVAWVALLWTGVGAADDTSAGESERERPISWEALPEPVRQTIRKEAGDREIIEIEEVTLDSGILYEAAWIVGEMEVEIAMTADGEVVLRETEPAGEGEDAEGDDTDGDATDPEDAGGPKK